MAKLGLRRYETQIRVFFILLVLMLLIINLMNFFLLSSSRRILLDTEIERGKALSTSAFREIAESGTTGVLAGPERLEPPAASAYLRRYALKNGFASLAILDPGGGIVASSENYLQKEKDKDFSRLETVNLQSLRSGIGVHTPPRGGRIVYFSPILTPAGELSGIMKSVHADLSLEREEKNYRVLIYSQATVIIIVLVLVIIFGSWVIKPFKAIEEAASRLPEEIKKEWGWTDEPILVEKSFKNVLEKIIEQEESLKRLHSHAESLTGSVEAFVNRVARDMVSGVIYLDSGRRIVTMNPEAEKILGADLKNARGESFESEASRIEGLSSLIDASLREGRRYSREVLRFVNKEGRKGHLGVAITPVRGEEGNPIGVLCMLTDLTEIQSLQERGRLRENLAAVGAVSAGIAHEFRNSLGAILAYARLIKKGKGLEDAQENAEAILKEVESTRRVVDDFLSYTKPARLNLITTDLRTILLEMKEDIAHIELLSGLTIELKGNPAEIQGDEMLLKQAFFNIVKNSAEAYGGSGGQMEIVIEQAEEKKFRISFIDFAGGISDEQMGNLFIPFFTTKESGIGLGLALAQKIIVSHDGTIEAENRKGVGLTFKVILPAKA